MLPTSAAPVLAAIPYRTWSQVDLGPLTIRTFGVLVAIGIVVGIAVTGRLLERVGVDRGPVEQLAVHAVMVGLVGARLAWVLTHLDQIDGPIDVIAVWEGGLQFSGGFLAAVALAAWRLRDTARDVRRSIADAAAVGLTVGLAIGRLGCIAVGEHWGGPTTFPLALEYLGGATAEGTLAVGVAYHNTAVYEAIHLAVLGLVFLWLYRSGRLVVGQGRAAGLFLVWYGVGRFLTDFVRVGDTRVAGLTGAQFVSVLVALVGIRLLTRAVAPAATPAEEDGTAGSEDTVALS